MKTLIIILLLAFFPAISFSQQSVATIETMASTFNFQGDTSGGGTCFMINKNGKEYFVTAAHLFKTSHKSGDVIPVQMLIQMMKIQA